MIVEGAIAFPSSPGEKGVNHVIVSWYHGGTEQSRTSSPVRLLCIETKGYLTASFAV
jgi:hypothetical protein